MTLQSPQPFDVSAYLIEGQARRRRLMRPPARPKPVLVSSQPEVKHAPLRLPMWEWGDMQFDAHVAEWRRYLFDQARGQPKSHIRRRSIELGFTPEEIESMDLRRLLTRARQIIAWELVRQFGLSYSYAGRLLGDRDHATIINSVKKIDALKVTGEIE